MEYHLKNNPHGNFTKYEDYFTAEDSFNLILYNNCITYDKALYLRKRDGKLFFVNGSFPTGEKLINIFLKKGYIEEVKENENDK